MINGDWLRLLPIVFELILIFIREAVVTIDVSVICHYLELLALNEVNKRFGVAQNLLGREKLSVHNVDIHSEKNHINYEVNEDWLLFNPKQNTWTKIQLPEV